MMFKAIPIVPKKVVQIYSEPIEAQISRDTNFMLNSLFIESIFLKHF